MRVLFDGSAYVALCALLSSVYACERRSLLMRSRARSVIRVVLHS